MLRPASTLQFSSYIAIFAMVRLIELWTWGSEVYQKVKMESKAIGKGLYPSGKPNGDILHDLPFGSVSTRTMQCSRTPGSRLEL